MDEHKESLRKTAMSIIDTLYQGEAFLTAGFLASDTQLWTPFNSQEHYPAQVQAYLKTLQAQAHKIRHKSCSIVEQTNDLCILSGSYHVEWEHDRAKKELMCYTMVLKRDSRGKTKIRHLHISQDRNSGLELYIKDIRERAFFIEEDELLYLEASHNHIIWHCKYFEVESVGSLKEMEKVLPQSFIRVQRSFIVNTRHVRKIARCYAEMDNTETIQIPVKRYCDIRKSILRTKGEQ
ncbi:MAG: LytTR family transcriptional regulator DNA-binding domain-containing protein [Lachnospiraceae bacterium]|nr:LytTR family transcriptional regulator DNA-binding domain-containing protein [Lachnospiraceae bacterium]MBO5146624.1 LytTR family transcriptional regulator DNA-binding domain-containing protein [Lachnospiraceae bacterium]